MNASYKKGTVGAYFIGDDVMLPCYSDGQTWNGFGCPAFELEAAKTIAKNDDLGLSYDEKNDRFVCKTEYSDDSCEEVFEPFVTEIDGEQIKLYSIGGWSWCWERVQFT